VEGMFHHTIINDFKKRYKQKKAYIIDAKNSSLLPKTYYEKAADLINSEEILKSVDMSLDYGHPFCEEYDLPPLTEEHRVTAESIKEKLVKLKGAILLIEDNLKASGEGEGSLRGNTVKDFTNGPRAKGKLANGDATGYTYIRLKELELFDHFVCVSPTTVAATMGNVPSIGSGEKRKATSSKKSSSKKKMRSNNADPINLLVRME